jgi:hypothetical protein
MVKWSQKSPADRSGAGKGAKKMPIVGISRFCGAGSVT